jgi:hypothetical protein
MRRLVISLASAFTVLVVAAIAGVAVLLPVVLPLWTDVLNGTEQVIDSGGFADRPGVLVEDDPDFGSVEVYTVLADGSLEPDAEGTAGEVWDLFVRIVGADVAGSVMLQYRAGDAPESDTLAYVFQDANPQYWSLAVNLATAEDAELMVATLVHEYAHVFSYDDEEFDRKATSCSTFAVYEGCIEASAYLYQFYDEFWADYTNAPDLENVDGDIAYEFYRANEDDFVSDYAATNIGEDFAETFMTFVLEESWEGDTVIARKLDFFTRFPELVQLRQEIRDEVAAELRL